MIACLIANALRGKGQAAHKPREFMPTLMNQRQEQTPKEIENVFRTMFSQRITKKGSK